MSREQLLDRLRDAIRRNDNAARQRIEYELKRTYGAVASR